MTVSLSIKNVPEEVLERLRARADRNRRSLQQELLVIVEAAAFDEGDVTVRRVGRVRQQPGSVDA